MRLAITRGKFSDGRIADRILAKKMISRLRRSHALKKSKSLRYKTNFRE
jgi:hypothetical protein